MAEGDSQDQEPAAPAPETSQASTPPAPKRGRPPKNPDAQPPAADAGTPPTPPAPDVGDKPKSKPKAVELIDHRGNEKTVLAENLEAHLAMGWQIKK